MGLFWSSLAIISVYLLDSDNLSYDAQWFISKIDNKFAPVFVTGCTSGGDIYTKKGTSFALLHHNNFTVLFMRDENGLVSTLGDESYDDKVKRIVREYNGGFWTENYARDIWEGLKSQKFIFYDGKFSLYDIYEAFNQSVCDINYNYLREYEFNSLK